MIDLTCWLANCPGVFVHIMACSGPTWLVSLPATENVIMSATPTIQVRTTV